MPWNGADHRKFPRVEQRCRLTVLSSGAPEVIEAVTENIGAGGVCVALKKNLGLFRKISLELYIDAKGDAVRCDAIIVWILKRKDEPQKKEATYDTGMEFLNISDSDRALVAAFVERIFSAKLDNEKNA